MPMVKMIDAEASCVRQVEVPEETDLRTLLGDMNIPTDTHLVRLNRQPVESLDYRLQEGDLISVTPSKIQGA